MIRAIISISIFVFFVACSYKDQHEYTDIYADYVCEYFDTYKDHYESIIDTFKLWQKDSLNFANSYRFHTWQIDSTIIFSYDSTRIFTVRFDQNEAWKHSEVSYLQPVGGSLINGKWYYYDMGWTLMVNNNSYKRKLYEPYTLEQLSYLSHKKVFRDALIKNGNEKYISNIAFFKKYFFSTHIPGEYHSKDYLDERTLSNNAKRGKISKERIDEIQAEIDATVRPPEPEQDYPKVMFFESEAWLNRPRCNKEKN